MHASSTSADIIPIGIGYYTVADAARLLAMPRYSIKRWLDGYAFDDDRGHHKMPPLWTPEIPKIDDQVLLSFRDLIELRFVNAFNREGVHLTVIRACLELARTMLDNPRPFTTRRFRTDGHTIFLESLNRLGDPEILDLKRKQYGFPTLIAKFFKDLDIEAESVTRWRPYKGRESIVIDPTRCFGQPIATLSGIPTETLADAMKAEGSIKKVAALYEIDAAAVRDAIEFQEQLLAA